ncbi:MAG: fibronectin type III domain-containing protein [Chloracidobacterium sp.]|nr:fibronectin type III domain-containing protein [Chloracidobacterium sp.]
MNTELTSGTGLIGRWGLNEGSGTTANNSIAGRPNGTLTNGPGWIAPDTTPPAAPTGLAATPGNTSVSLAWAANSEGDIAGYNVYRSTSPSVPLTSPINGGTPVVGTAYNDTGRTNGQIYYYVITAVDTSANQSGASNEVNATPAVLPGALQFDGTNDYVTFGPNLNATAFTLEAWVKRSAGGATMSTGTNGLDGTSGHPLVYPVLTKGMGQGETPANINMNWFLGITSTGVVGADFEDNADGGNHPAWGSTTIPVGEWHHIAATYTGSCWALFVDGSPDTLNGAATQCPNATPEFTSIQHAGLAAGIGSTGQLAAGFFAGTIDEARVWNLARSQSEILSTVNSELTSGTGLIARWGLNEGTGLTANSSVGSFPGTLTSGPVWVTPGAPFNIATLTVPGAPTGVIATGGDANAQVSWTAPASDGGSAIINYSVTPYIGAAAQGPILVGSAATSLSVSGLVNGTSYTFTVAAINAVGVGPASSASNAVTPNPPTTSLQLQDGLNGYTGTRDTYIYDVGPTTVRGAEVTFVQDKNVGDERRSLLQFDLSAIPPSDDRFSRASILCQYGWPGIQYASHEGALGRGDDDLCIDR